jgi:hypothetical protein
MAFFKGGLHIFISARLYLKLLWITFFKEKTGKLKIMLMFFVGVIRMAKIEIKM